MNIHKLKSMMSMSNITLEEKVLQRTVFSSFFFFVCVCVSNCFQVYQAYQESSFSNV